MMANELLTREEILTGLLAKRARTRLFLIESLTAQMVAQSQRVMERFLSEEAAKERDLAYLEAFSLGRQPPLRPTIQNLERYAPNWGALIPESPRMCAALAHSLSQKYSFTREAIPNIRTALGLDRTEVQEAYQSLYNQPLPTTIYTPHVKLADQLRWGWSVLAGWIEALPPFWTAFALTLTETVGAGVLALPIATAGIGPLAGVTLLIIFGLMNVLTIAYMAEAVSRSGTARYGSAFIGRIVYDYLGSAGSVILSMGVLAICFLALLAFYIGFAATMEDVTHLPAEIWVALLFLLGLYYVRRESLNATVASALLVGAINISLILILSLLAFSHMQPENLLFVSLPFIGGRPFEPAIMELIFGVIIAAYFGHLSVSNCAKVVIHRDPSGRSLIWGCMVAQVVAMLIYSIWILAVNGAIDPQSLVNEAGTALIPLASQVGSIVRVLGSIFVILGMGMASIHFSLGLFNLTRERLPGRSQPLITLPRRQGSLIFSHRRRSHHLRIVLTYLGLQNNRPYFRLDIQTDDQMHRVEIEVSDRWDLHALSRQLPNLDRSRDHLTLEVLQASRKSITLRVDSSLRLMYEGEWDVIGLGVADMLTLTDTRQQVITWLMRQRTANLAQLAAYLEQDEASTRELLALMADEGLIVETFNNGEANYRVLFSQKRGAEISQEIWQALDQPAQPLLSKDGDLSSRSGSAAVQRNWNSGLSERSRNFLSVGAILLVFLLAEWLLLMGGGSFSGLLSMIGVIIVSLLAGIFPVLLLISSRQKGEFIPGVVYRFLGQPLFLASIYILSLASLFIHGLFIWENPIQRAIALLVGVFILGITLFMKQRGAFAPRAVVVLQVDQQQNSEASFAIVAAGQPAPATVQLTYPDGEQQIQAAAGRVPAFASLHHATFQLPANLAQELKVWAYQITSKGEAENLPGQLNVYTGQEVKQFDLKLAAGAVVLPLKGGISRVEIDLPETSKALD